MDELAPVLIEFDSKASTLFFSLYEKFKDAVKHLDRRKDENVFQLQQAKYLNELKSQLDHLAKGLLNKYNSMKSVSQLNKKFTDEINQYQNEFRQKSMSL
jgi:hypothetical protein